MGEQILNEIQVETKHVVNLMGETSLEELGGFLSECDFLLSGDTGTVHVAAAVGTKTISTSYGMTYPYETAPYGPEHLILFSDLPCAPCDDPNVCSYEMACERILLSEVLIHGITAAIALAEGDGVKVKRVIEDPQLQGVRILYTGKGQVTGDLKLYDLREGIPNLEKGWRPAAKEEDQILPKDMQKLTAAHKTIEQILVDIDAALKQFSRGEKAQGFQAILPIFDRWYNVIRSMAELEHEMGDVVQEITGPILALHEKLLPVLQKMGQAMEKMDLATIQDILSNELKSIAKEEKKVLKNAIDRIS